MGDTGSLVVGFLISVIVIITLSSKNDYNQAFNNLPVIVLSILSFPYVDTLRVIIIRKKHSKKFFEPDKNHIHHKILSIYNNHIKTTITILLVCLINIIFCLSTSKLNITLHFIVCLIFSVSSFILVVYFFKRKLTKRNN